MLFKNPESGESHQHVAGFVTPEGGLLSGDGVKSVTRTNTGEYRIEFAAPFAAPPAVVATLHNPTKDLSVHAVITYGITTTYVDILTGDADAPYPDAKYPDRVGAPKDSAFCFIAFGNAAA